jgi:predicted DNA binding protein
MVIELALGPPFDEYLRNVFERVDNYEILGLLKIDFHQGVKVGIMEVKMKEGFGIDDISLPPPAELITVLQSEGDTYTCIVKVQAPKDMLGTFNKFDLDVIWDTPMRIAEDGIVFSVVGEDDELKKCLEVFEDIGEVKEIHVQQPTFHQEDILTSLTDRQKEVLIAAKRYGYYDYPRRMNAEELSSRVGVSKATLVEHLRKAEGRLLANILAGY